MITELEFRQAEREKRLQSYERTERFEEEGAGGSRDLVREGTNKLLGILRRWHSPELVAPLPSQYPPLDGTRTAPWQRVMEETNEFATTITTGPSSSFLSGPAVDRTRNEQTAGSTNLARPPATSATSVSTTAEENSQQREASRRAHRDGISSSATASEARESVSQSQSYPATDVGTRLLLETTRRSHSRHEDVAKETRRTLHHQLHPAVQLQASPKGRHGEEPDTWKRLPSAVINEEIRSHQHAASWSPMSSHRGSPSPKRKKSRQCGVQVECPLCPSAPLDIDFWLTKHLTQCFKRRVLLERSIAQHSFTANPEAAALAESLFSCFHKPGEEKANSGILETVEDVDVYFTAQAYHCGGGGGAHRHCAGAERNDMTNGRRSRGSNAIVFDGVSFVSPDAERKLLVNHLGTHAEEEGLLDEQSNSSVLMYHLHRELISHRWAHIEEWPAAVAQQLQQSTRGGTANPKRPGSPRTKGPGVDRLFDTEDNEHTRNLRRYAEFVFNPAARELRKSISLPCPMGPACAHHRPRQFDALPLEADTDSDDLEGLGSPMQEMRKDDHSARLAHPTSVPAGRLAHTQIVSHMRECWKVRVFKVCSNLVVPRDNFEFANHLRHPQLELLGSSPCRKLRCIKKDQRSNGSLHAFLGSWPKTTVAEVITEICPDLRPWILYCQSSLPSSGKSAGKSRKANKKRSWAEIMRGDPYKVYSDDDDDEEEDAAQATTTTAVPLPKPVATSGRRSTSTRNEDKEATRRRQEADSYLARGGEAPEPSALPPTFSGRQSRLQQSGADVERSASVSVSESSADTDSIVSNPTPLVPPPSHYRYSRGSTDSPAGSGNYPYDKVRSHAILQRAIDISTGSGASPTGMSPERTEVRDARQQSQTTGPCGETAIIVTRLRDGAIIPLETPLVDAWALDFVVYVPQS